ncbi:hypothetical protein QTJ16_000831 [Diplocarpon rosae]|uniref:Uncharacterized protein n=1 Tax=Diplocarpon rosae TaxID=946125 RepID=A0AAD9T6E3_9HELO|nr:hypothetical protein QTJ16_000831 [Diplocarpon rosae]
MGGRRYMGVFSKYELARPGRGLEDLSKPPSGGRRQDQKIGEHGMISPGKGHFSLTLTHLFVIL